MSEICLDDECIIVISPKRKYCSTKCAGHSKRMRKTCNNMECNEILTHSSNSKYCTSNCRKVSNPMMPAHKIPHCYRCKKRFYTSNRQREICDNCKAFTKIKNKRKYLNSL